MELLFSFISPNPLVDDAIMFLPPLYSDKLKSLLKLAELLLKALEVLASCLLKKLSWEFLIVLNYSFFSL